VKERVAKTCPICNRGFSITPSRGHVKTCSRKCGIEYKKRFSEPRKMSPRTGIRCANCDKEFFVPPNAIGRKYCSDTCYHSRPTTEEFRKKMSLVTKKEHNGMWGKKHKKESISKMSANRSGILHSEESKRKMSISRKGRRPPCAGMPGEKNGNWKGGITPICLAIRLSHKYRLWRADVITKDRFTCMLCGSVGVNLEVDHYPKKFNTIFKESGVKTTADAYNYEEFWDINNGRTLCRNCHRRYHGKLPKV
jgi:5-methylcytosine-specific restriction endonuclease McrA